MAEGATIGALRFVLGADTAQLEAATGKASASMRAAARAGEVAGQQIAAAFTRLGGALAGALAVDSLINFATESLKSAAAIGRFADQAGLTAQQFQGLDHALRDSQVPTEQLAQGFAIFSRNLSDLQRGTGPLLDFLRRSAPQLVAQFRAATSTADAFGILTDAVNRLAEPMDRVRILNAAGAEQFGRLANSMRQGRTAIEEQARSFQGLSDSAISKAQEIERRWAELWRNITLAGQRTILAAIDQFTALNQANAQAIEAEIRRLEGIKASQERLGRNITAVTAQIERQRIALDELRLAADNVGAAPPPAPPPDAGRLQADAIKAAQDRLTLFLAQLSQLPSQTAFVSGAFEEAWARMDAAMAASGASEAARAAARIQLIQQEAGARIQALGAAMTVEEQQELRRQQLQLARNQGLITETEHQRALNIARAEYSMSQLTELQSLGVTLTAEEQHAMALDRISVAYARGAISADQFKRASQTAALNTAQTYLNAAGQITSALSGAFQKSKALAAADATISAIAGATRAYKDVPYPYNIAVSAAILAAGMANVHRIMSTNPGSAGGGAATPSVSAPAEVQSTPSQSFTINLPDRNYTHAEVAAIIDGINERVNNGVTLIATKVAA
jgi:hypothetical protein